MWDVGGQKSLRSYWRNYFESTDGIIWVVDSADKRRLEDCRAELHTLLMEEVNSITKINQNNTKNFDNKSFKCNFLCMIGCCIHKRINCSVFAMKV